ncbi:MAG TPA: peptidylprolyl isomerase [Vicinamibacterales bacterium]|nr:peptidylprolyl isomerase [Vicinamibacterales bacterium]
MTRSARVATAIVAMLALSDAGRAQTKPPAPAAGAPTREALMLAVDRLMVDRTYPEPAAGATDAVATRIARDREMLQRALKSDDAAMRRLAVRSLGRFERPADVPALAPFLDDADEGVRIEAAQALAQTMQNSRDAAVQPAVDVIRKRLPGTTGNFRRMLLQALGRLRTDAATTKQLEQWLVTEQRADDAVVWLAPVLIRDRAYRPADQTTAALRKLADPESPTVPPNPFAIQALATSLTENDATLLARALGYRCATGADPACGWEVRYAAVAATNRAWTALDRPFELTLRDPAFQVRLAALRKLATTIPTRQTCAPLISAFADPMPTVALEAMTLVDPKCREAEDIKQRLAGQTAELSKPASASAWHVPARAFESLVRFDPERAGAVMRDVATKHAAWQVRAAAARVAVTLKDETTLKTLASDKEPNVRTEAIAGLTRLKSPAVVDEAVRALTATDFQLLRQAAQSLRGTQNPEPTIVPLLDALQRLTKEGKDTSRDPRVAILERLRELAPPNDAGTSRLAAHLARLTPYLSDFDPRVAALAGEVIDLAAGAPPTVTPTRRAPQQPTEAQLRALPVRASATMDNGDTFELDLLVDDAPLTVARFVALARAGYYNGLTLHRVEPLFVVQGGSPGANEYVGDARYLRDEIGMARHDRGAVGISTRGRDTGDAQIFIDLIDVPRLNFSYTVFARVRTDRSTPTQRRGMDAVDWMLSGARIKRIDIR